MSYTPTEWKGGDVITAEKMNKIESGINEVSGTFYVRTISAGSGTLTASLADIVAAVDAGKNVILITITAESDVSQRWTTYHTLLSYEPTHNRVTFFIYNRFSNNAQVSIYISSPTINDPLEYYGD